MTDPHERLRAARESAGFPTATAAAEAMNIKPAGYIHHENGTAGLSRAGERYARFFRVNYEWLMTGRGDMKSATPRVPVMGYVGAGALVDPINHIEDQQFPDDIDLPAGDNYAALIVKGDSQFPRFMDGEIVIYDTRPANIESLIGRYAVVQTLDGRMLIKIIRKSPTPDHWILESFNAAAEVAPLLGAWQYVATIAPHNRPLRTLRPKRTP